MEQEAAEKDGDGTQTILRYESLTEVLKERILQSILRTWVGVEFLGGWGQFRALVW